MIPRRLRLSRRDFESIATLPGLKRAQSPHFSISYGLAEGRGGSSVVVPKKVEKSSVKRHILKRRIREIIRPHSAEDRVLVVYARPGSTALPFAAISDELSELLSRSGL